MFAGGTATAVGLGVAGYALRPAPEPVSPAPETVSVAVPEAQVAPEVTPDATPEPSAAQIAAAPSFDVVRVAPEGQAVIAGHAAPGSQVQLTLDGAPLENVDVDASGNFVALLDLPMEAPGTLGLSTVDETGKTTASLSGQTVIISPRTQPAKADPQPVQAEPAPPATSQTEIAQPASEPAAPTDPSAPAAPTELALATEPAEPRVLLADDQGITVLQDGSGQPKVDNVVIDTIAYDETGEVSLTGRGQGGANVRVYLDNSPIKSVEISQTGQWRAPLEGVDSGVYTLRVDEIAEDGSVTSRTETPFKREEPAQLAAVSAASDAPRAPVTAVTVQTGSTLWAIAREHLGDGPLYVRVFEANKDQIRDPDLIYPGQVFSLPSGG